VKDKEIAISSFTISTILLQIIIPAQREERPFAVNKFLLLQNKSYPREMFFTAHVRSDKSAESCGQKMVVRKLENKFKLTGGKDLSPLPSVMD
jgi:hypothetical protein